MINNKISLYILELQFGTQDPRKVMPIKVIYPIE